MDRVKQKQSLTQFCNTCVSVNVLWYNGCAFHIFTLNVEIDLSDDGDGDDNNGDNDRDDDNNDTMMHDDDNDELSEVRRASYKSLPVKFHTFDFCHNTVCGLVKVKEEQSSSNLGCLQAEQKHTAQPFLWVDWL